MALSLKSPSRAVLTLGMIRAVTVALRTRNMKEAALILGISQSAVTQYVNKFEMITGIKILTRVGNSLFVERTDIAEVMDKITDLSQQMDRLVLARAPKPTLALPYTLGALLATHAELAGWMNERYHYEVLTFRELARQSSQNSFDFVVRPLRDRESEVDYQFSCLFQVMKPQAAADTGAKPGPLPVMLPGGECPTHAAALDVLDANSIDYAEVGRSEDVNFRAMHLHLGLSATLLPSGFASHSPLYHNFESCVLVGEPISVRFGLIALKHSSETSNAMAFLDQFCGKLQDHGVINGA